MANLGSFSTPGLRGLHHVSRVCADLEKTSFFYRDLLGFIPVKRPQGLRFDGVWLYSPHCCVGLHLILGRPVPRPSEIDVHADHLSFLVSSLADVEALLKERGVHYVKQCIIEEEGVKVHQLFFHDPENNMIEICNCDDLPVVPLAALDGAMGLPCTTCRHCASPARSKDPELGDAVGCSCSSDSVSAAHSSGDQDCAMSDHSNSSHHGAMDMHHVQLDHHNGHLVPVDIQDPLCAEINNLSCVETAVRTAVLA